MNRKTSIPVFLVLGALVVSSASAYVLLSPRRSWPAPPTITVDNRGNSTVTDSDGGATAVVNALNASVSWNGAGTGAIPAQPSQPDICQAFPNLTPRQADVLKIVLRGSPDKLIARELGISPNTVRTHLKTIYAELGVQTRGEAVYLASRRGIRIA